MKDTHANESLKAACSAETKTSLLNQATQKNSRSTEMPNTRLVKRPSNVLVISMVSKRWIKDGCKLKINECNDLCCSFSIVQEFPHTLYWSMFVYVCCCGRVLDSCLGHDLLIIQNINISLRYLNLFMQRFLLVLGFRE